MSRVEIRRDIGDDDWALVKALALRAFGKVPVTPPSMDWKEAMLYARHSPVRELRFVFDIDDVPYWVAGHLVRHVHAQPYVRSQRDDRRTGPASGSRADMPQDTLVSMSWSMNAEELITVANKRLCAKASAETGDVVWKVCALVISRHPEFGRVLVPNCMAHGGVCYEVGGCGMCRPVREYPELRDMEHGFWAVRGLSASSFRLVSGALV